jgi:hypothetical protein
MQIFWAPTVSLEAPAPYLLADIGLARVCTENLILIEGVANRLPSKEMLALI